MTLLLYRPLLTFNDVTRLLPLMEPTAMGDSKVLPKAFSATLNS